MTLLAVLGSAVVICACSVAVGQAVWRVAGFRGWSWLAGPVGLATLVAVCLPAASLPGKGVTGAATLALVTAGSLALLARDRELRVPLVETVVVLVLGLAAASLPFAAAGRVGIPGVTDNADLSAHLMLAESVRTGDDPIGIAPSWYLNYPTGPHALVASLDDGLGVPLDAAFTGLLLATLALSALAGLALLREARPSARVAGALVAGIPYLGAAYTVQASFKETLLALCVVGWTVALPVVAPQLRHRPRAVIPLALLAAGAYGDYSFPGLAWLAAVAVAYGGAHLLHARRIRRPAITRRWVVAPGLFLAIVFLSALPQLDRAKALGGAVEATAAGKTTGGNIRGEIPGYEVFGVWPSSDLRAFGANLNLSRAAALLGIGAAVWGAWWWWRRRRFELPAAAAATFVLYAGARLTATPYYSAKALAIGGFAMSLMSVSAVVLGLPEARRLRVPRPARSVLVAAGVAFLALAAWSSGLALRGARVESAEHRDELASLRPLLAGQAVLYMGENDYLPWELRGVKVSFPYINIGNSQVPLDVRAEKPWTIDDPFDFDSVAPMSLDDYRFVLEPRSRYASAPPPNWRLARQTRSYQLWEQRGRTRAHSILPERNRPGAVLDCSAAPNAALAARQGSAAVRPKPVLVSSSVLRTTSGAALRVERSRLRRLDAGREVTARVRLPAGRWEVSLQYVSPVALRLSAGSRELRVPASMEGPGVFWRMGVVDVHGTVTELRVRADDAPPLAAFRIALIGSLAFVREDARTRVVPLAEACGRYVDWYRETS